MTGLTKIASIKDAGKVVTAAALELLTGADKPFPEEDEAFAMVLRMVLLKKDDPQALGGPETWWSVLATVALIQTAKFGPPPKIAKLSLLPTEEA